MYTGITQGLFPVVNMQMQPNLLTYTVRLNNQLMQGLVIGASVSIDGVCQSVRTIENNDVTFDAMQETLEKTTLSDMSEGCLVSVERSAKFGDEIGGHEMAGHVNGTAEVADIIASENNLQLTIRCPKDWMKYILPKGFIAVDGSSLTVGDTEEEGLFNLHLIPETVRVTNFGNKEVGDRVNIELDAKTRTIVDTVERILQARL